VLHYLSLQYRTIEQMCSDAHSITLRRNIYDVIVLSQTVYTMCCILGYCPVGNVVL